ncbi:MAG: hypothetical protein ACFHX7_22890 [Pseudomonadota bacterium]
MAIVSGVAIFDVVQISFPRFTLDAWTYQSLQSFENFRAAGMLSAPAAFIVPGGRPGFVPEPAPALPLSEAEVTARREARLAQVMETHRHDAARSLIQMAIFLLVSGALFAIHWQLARRLEVASAERGPLD